MSFELATLAEGLTSDPHINKLKLIEKCDACNQYVPLSPELIPLAHDDIRRNKLGISLRIRVIDYVFNWHDDGHINYWNAKTR